LTIEYKTGTSEASTQVQRGQAKRAHKCNGDKRSDHTSVTGTSEASTQVQRGQAKRGQWANFIKIIVINKFNDN